MEYVNSATGGRIIPRSKITAMTTFLVLTLALVLVELVAGVRLLRQDRPTAAPSSHPDWSSGSLPSSPYILRH